MTSAAGVIHVFEPARFESLYDIIHTVSAVPDACDHDWYLAVERNKHALSHLGRVQGPNDTERRDISKGVILVHGKEKSLNADFVAQTLLLSDELQVSEGYAASLLQEGIAARARWGRAPSEVACLLYYRERLALLACVKELARGTYTLCVGGDLRTGIRMGRVLDDVLQDGVFLQNVITELDTLHSERERVKASMQKARTTNASLSDEVQIERFAWIHQAEQELCHVVYLLALARRLGPSAIETLLTYLAKCTVPTPTAQGPTAPSTSLCLMTAILAVLDTVPDEAGEWLSQHSTAPLYTAEALRNDARCLESIWRIVSTGAWVTPGIQHVVQLQLAVFLTEAFATHTSLSPALGQSADDVQALAMRAITSENDASALLFLLLRVLSFRRGSDDDIDVEDLGPVSIDPEFQEYVLQQVEHLMRGLTSTCFPLLRKMQRSEEDAAISTLRASRPGSGVASSTRRYDIEALFDLMALLCRGRPESGLPFWQGPDRRISRFLLWAVDTRELGQQRALLGMLSSLAEGEQCAVYAHALLEHEAAAPTGSERRLVTWSHLFDWVAHYIEAFQRHTVAVMPPEEMLLLRGFLGVLATVVRYSPATRDALFSHKAYAPLERLFALYACAVPMDLKAALLRAMAAFATQTGTGASPRILSALWDNLDQSGAIRSVRGEPPRALYELEHIECVHGRYPGTHALVSFLRAILPHVAPVSNAATLVAHMQDTLSLTAPMLASRKSSAHAVSYVTFVLDHVLLPASTRTYARPAERWSLSAACLEFAEQCLATLPVAPLDSTHPGFDVLRRLLSGTPFLQEIFFFVHPDPSCAGYEVINFNMAQTPDYVRVVRAALRILLHVLDLQNDVLHVLPLTHDAALKDRALFLPLDAHLLHAHQIVVQVALYVHCVDAEAAWLAVRLLRALARTSTFQATDAFGPLRARTSCNRLVGLLDMTGETSRVVSGVLAWLEADSDDGEDAGASPAKIQRELLDLFLDQLAPDAPAPNVAHLLLGFDMNAPESDRLVQGSRDALLHTLVKRVTPPSTWTPALAERCYAVLHRACLHPYTSASMLRFLRMHDFCAVQLRALPLTPMAVPDQGTLVYGATGEAISTSPEWALALLHTHAHMLSLVALELHTLAAHDQLPRAAPLLAILLGEPTKPEFGDIRGRWRSLLDATDVTWMDEYEGHNPKLAARLSPALVQDPVLATSRAYDIHAVASLLLEERGTQDHAVWLDQARLVLLWAASQNTRKALAHARQEACAAWRQVLDVLVCDVLSTTVRVDVRAPFLLDCVSALLPRLNETDETMVPSIAASTILSLLHAVRACEDQSDADLGMIGPDRLVDTVRAILHVVCAAGSLTSASMRYDLYLSVVCAVQMVLRTSAAPRMHTLLVAHADNLVHVLARDALDGSDVMQTVALTTLSHLVAWDATKGNASMRVGERLASAGYMKSLVLRIQELDMPLQATLVPDPPSLNALYVYEALLTLLGRLAHTRASLLMDARIVDVLARVDFPSLRPEHTLDDTDGFLPPVAERYASLLTPLLQLLAAILASMPHTHNSVHALLLAHQDALLATLHAATQPSPGISDVEQAALLVQILTFVTPPSPFHAACLALAATYLVPNAHDLLRPLTPTEREDASILALTYNGLVQTAADTRLTLFESNARRAVDHLARALVQYMEQTSSEGDARAILVPSMHVARVSDHASSAARVVAAPSLGVAIAALGDQCTSLTLAISSLERVESYRRDPDAVHADEWADLAQEAGLMPSSSVLSMQYRATCIKALERVSRDLVTTVEAKLDMVERWLVLLVRHLDLFMHMSSARASFNTDALRSGARAMLMPILEERLAYLSVPAHIVPSADDHATFLQMGARRIAEELLDTPLLPAS